MGRGYFLHLLTSFALLTTLISCNSSSINNEIKTVFRYNQSGGLTSLDPAFASSQANIWATSQLFQGLVELDSNLHVIPAVAKSWDISTDGLSYDFHLRQDVAFHDHELFANGRGRKVVAKDFVYSFQRIIDSTSIYNRGMWIFKDKVLSKADGSISDTCFKAINDSTLRIYLQKPVPYFLEILSMPYAFVVPYEIAEHYGKDFRNHPIGTGAFKFFMWEEGNALVMHRNNSYWASDSSGKSLPYLDAVMVSFVPDKSQAYRKFLVGEIDYFSGIEQGAIDEILQADGSFRPDFIQKYKGKKAPYLNTEYLGFQLNAQAPCYNDEENVCFLNQNFRKALNFSIDKNRMMTYIKNNIGSAGNQGFIPPAVPYVNRENIDSTFYDIRRAKAYLDSSGFAGTEQTLTLHIASEHKPLSEYLIKQWKDVLNIKFNLIIHESGALRHLANSGEIPFFRGSWLGDYPDAENYLGVFYSKYHTPNGPNKTHFTNTEFDSLFLKAYSYADEKQRVGLYERMDNIIVEQSPVIVLYYDEVIQLTKKRVTGLPINAMNSLKLDKVKFYLGNE